MKFEEIRENLCMMGSEDTVLFENPNYETAFLGISGDGRAIYDMDKMVEYLVETDGMTEDEAIEFIDYNSIRACDYIANSPIVLYKVE